MPTATWAPTSPSACRSGRMPDSDFPGPLAGFLAGLERCADAVPGHRAVRLATVSARPGGAAGRALHAQQAEIWHRGDPRGRRARAAASGLQPDARVAVDSLVDLHGRRAAPHRPLDRPAPLRRTCCSTTVEAFFNANTPEDLHRAAEPAENTAESPRPRSHPGARGHPATDARDDDVPDDPTAAGRLCRPSAGGRRAAGADPDDDRAGPGRAALHRRTAGHLEQQQAAPLQLLGQHLQRLKLKAQWVPVKSEAAVLTALVSGKADLAWLDAGTLTPCRPRPTPPARCARSCSARRTKKAHSVVIVRAASPVKRLQDLKGRAFSFGPKGSATAFPTPRRAAWPPGRPGQGSGQRRAGGVRGGGRRGGDGGQVEAGALGQATWEARRWPPGRSTTRARFRVIFTSAPYPDRVLGGARRHARG